LNRSWKIITLGAALASWLNACTWVKLTEEGGQVVVMATAPERCEKLGTTRSLTRSDIASIDRNRKKVASELETLARNAAAAMGGDAITAESEVSDKGEQAFGIYRCGT
jgi:hypothetical protein